MSIFTLTHDALQRDNDDNRCFKQWLGRGEGNHQLVTLDEACVVLDLKQSVSYELSIMTGSKTRTLLIKDLSVDNFGIDVLISHTLTYVAINGQKIRFEHRYNGSIICHVGETKKCRLLIPPRTPVNFIAHDCILDVSDRLHVEHFHWMLLLLRKIRLTDLSVCYDCLDEGYCVLNLSVANVHARVRRQCCLRHQKK